MKTLEESRKFLEIWKELDKNDDSPEIAEIAQHIRQLAKKKNIQAEDLVLKVERQIEKQERLENPEKLYLDFIYLTIQQTTTSLQHWTQAMRESKRIFRFWV